MEEQYADTTDGPGTMAGGGGDQKEHESTSKSLKRAKLPEDEGDPLCVLCPCLISVAATQT